MTVVHGTPNAIVFTSNTGYTAEYARMLGKRTGLQVYDYATACRKLSKDNSVIYLGWLMAGQVKGYKKAAARYHICAVCAVGMCSTGSEMQDVRKNNAIPESVPVFTLQGGFDLQKLTGIYKLMMTIMKNTAGKGLAEKADRSPDEDAMLDLLTNGGSRVCEENLEAVLTWYHCAFQKPVTPK